MLVRLEAIILQSFPIILFCTSQIFLPLFFQLHLLFCRTFQFKHRKSHKTCYWHTYNKTWHNSVLVILQHNKCFHIILQWTFLLLTNACRGSWLPISRLSSLRCWICWWHVDWSDSSKLKHVALIKLFPYTLRLLLYYSWCCVRPIILKIMLA